MVKTIYSDVFLNFGKYKGKSVVDALAQDPGYFYWCRESGVARLDADVNEIVDGWARSNPGEASKARRSAELARKTKEAESVFYGEEKKSSVAAPPVANQRVASSQDSPSWGVW